MSIYNPRNLQLARRANKYGAHYSLRIIIECRRYNIPISLGFALVEKESGFRNVFGHDPTQSIPDRWKGTVVTKDKYKYYKSRRSRYGMQGVGPTQLTWYEFQDRADKLGGCWSTRYNIRVGISILASYYHRYKKHHSTRESVRLAGRDYNGSGSAADAYGNDLVKRFNKWHNRLT